MKQAAKMLIFLFILVSTYSSYAANLKIGADEILLLSSGVGNKFLHYIVNKNKISEVPSWDGVGEAPLSIKAVTSIALSKHKKLNGNVESNIKKVSLSSKETYCSAKQKCPKTLWYYKVKVRGEKRSTYVILMNGKFIDPRI